MQKLKIIYVEKKQGYDVEAKALLQDFRENLRINSLKEVRVINRYVTEYMDEVLFNKAAAIVFSESTVDRAFFTLEELEKEYTLFGVEYLPGQYDQRADAAMQCLAVIKEGEAPKVSCAVIIALKGDISSEELKRIKSYYINPVEKREARLTEITIEENYGMPQEIPVYEGFITMGESELYSLHRNLGLAMSMEDLHLCQDYFIKEKRNPTETEIRVLDTYWSDHCRHTTFQTSITKIDIEEGPLNTPLKKSYEDYLKVRKELSREEKPVNLMDLATIAMKELKNRGLLEDLDESDEINACTIKVKVETTEGTEDYLILFKNETHNHPTEIEPFGGAATCLGGAIRDPLSGRAYVYQAMRITGSGDPRERIEDTLKGKLPQRKITLGAAAGYSSYGNQIGLATGQVVELYDPGFKAKRMEIGAVIGAVPEKQVKREKPLKGDLVILLGGRTGRDGCGGATGSSKEHNLESINECGAEVQKGNAPVERKLQRFFRRAESSIMIKRCNDFGAGGVSVAIGELSDSLDIYLDRVPKKYEGLNGTELAISESQERMAVVIAPENENSFIAMAREENLEATTVAEVTDSGRLRMWWRDRLIVDIARSFLDTNGAEAFAEVLVKNPEEKDNYFNKERAKAAGNTFKELLVNQLKDLNSCSQKGLSERFDSTIGANTVLMPFGGAEEITPPEGMASRIPVLKGSSNTVSLMTYGYNPRIASWSPYHGAHYAVVEAVSRIAAMGGDYRKIKLTFQEYFEKLGKNKEKWGKPFAALLGGYEAQRELEIGAIGGKDSMSGTFENLTVPPTLVAFAVALDKIDNVLSPELKANEGQEVYIIKTPITDEYTVDFKVFKENLTKLKEAVDKGYIASVYALREGGIAVGISKMAFGNNLGIILNEELSLEDIIAPSYGSFLIQLTKDRRPEEILGDLDYFMVAELSREASMIYKDESINLEDLRKAWEEPLEEIFPTKISTEAVEIPEEGSNIAFIPQNKKSYLGTKIPQPKVFIPVFPGTNCEYDSERAFEREGALVNTLVLKNLTSQGLREAISEMEKEIKNSQILMLPGGFSAADEPEGSGKFIASVFRNKYLAEAVEELLYKRDGLILGICNGFQALIKLGLLPYGRIVEINENMPTLTYNNIGRHVSSMVETKVVSKLSPWFEEIDLGEIHKIPVSHGEGRFTASPAVMQELIKNGQIATQYVDREGKPTLLEPYNPNGSVYAIEGITSPDGRILGKMAHSERGDRRLYKNIQGNLEQRIFSSGVNYFK
ncbi:MAG: phosphoribosylformylglycinamidine synthase [Clostridiaceae bacterium]